MYAATYGGMQFREFHSFSTAFRQVFHRLIHSISTEVETTLASPFFRIENPDDHPGIRDSADVGILELLEDCHPALEGSLRRRVRDSVADPSVSDRVPVVDQAVGTGLVL